MEPEYKDRMGQVPVAELYESVTIEEGTISKGDVAVWEEPDCSYHDDDVMSAIYVGFVKKIYKKDEPQLDMSTPIPLVGIDNNLKAVSGRGINLDRDGGSMKFVDNFLNSRYEKYMKIEWCRDGTHKVSGE